MKEQEIAPGVSIVGFDSMEEMLLYMAGGEKDANESVLAPQEKITWGDYVVRLHQATNMMLAIWSHLHTQEQVAAEITDSVEEQAEVEAELRGLTRAHARGFRYGRWFSQVLPQGEYGSAHIVSCWPITSEDYEMARTNDWQLWPEIFERINAETEEALKAAGQPGLEEGNVNEGDS